MKKLGLLFYLLVITLSLFAQSDDYQMGVNHLNDGNYQKAFSFFQKSAKQGNVYAQFNLALMYYQGHGVTQDYNKAFEWYLKAANQGNINAQYNLAEMYYSGIGVIRDYNKALEWYIKAANQGDAEAQLCVGYMYYHGEGVSKDYGKAIEWYEKSANNGYLKAMTALGEFYYAGEGVEIDYQKAEMWFKKVIEADETSPYPYSYLAMIIAQRDKNYNEALRYSDMSIARMNNEDPKLQAVLLGERGLIYVWKGDMENAEKILAKCLEHNSDYLKENLLFTKMMLSYHSNEVDNNIISNPATNMNTFAIIIGNEKYKNEVDVPFANNDANIFSKYVEKTLGVPSEQIKCIENAGYNDIRIAVNWLVQAMQVCRGKGKAIVYYAGHGIPNESDLSSYLLPVDGIGNDPGSAYSLKELYEKLGSVEAQSITIFFDACFSGSKREEGMLASARGVALKAKKNEAKGNMIVFSAAQGDETAYPYKEKQHGMFTYFLLKKLQETKGAVTLGELDDYLKDEVKRQSFLKNNKIQTPTVSVATGLQKSWKQIKLK